MAMCSLHWHANIVRLASQVWSFVSALRTSDEATLMSVNDPVMLPSMTARQGILPQVDYPGVLSGEVQCSSPETR
jgi:hypothetical protein